METQAISAPVEKLTREAPKRQAGYGLPCAKCHKYFPADLEVCPICKGRERVSPIVAPRIKKPVQSETSVAASSTNVALTQDVKESPKSESSALVQPIEIKVKDQLVEQKKSIAASVIAETPAGVGPAPTSLVSTEPVLTQREKESPISESPAVVAPVEVKVKDQPLGKKEPVKSPAVVVPPVAADPAPARLASTQAVLTPKEKQSPKLEFPVIAPPVEINAKDQPLDHEESITTPVVEEIPTAVEQAPASLVSTQPVVTQKEKQFPKSESPAIAPPAEIKVQDQPLGQKESITTPVAEIPVAAESARASLVVSPKEKESPESPATASPAAIKVKDQPLNQKESIATSVVAELSVASLVPTETKESPKSESPAFDPSLEIKVKDQALDQKELPTIPVAAAAVEPARSTLVSKQPVSTQIDKKSPKPEPPTSAQPVGIEVKDQPLKRKESTAVPIIQLPAPVEPLTASLVPSQKAKESPKPDSPSVMELNDRPINDHPQKELIATPAHVEAQASDPVPAPMPKELECTTKLEPAAVALPMQPDTEEQRRDKINQALRIVIPMLVETQISEPASVAAKQEPEEEKKEQAPKMSEVPKSASEVKVVEAKPVETKTIEVKTVASPTVVDQANHRPVAEKSKAIDKRVDAPAKPADVNAPVVVHVNLGELRASKSSPEHAPAQSKEIERTEPETSNSDTTFDTDALESPAPVGGRRFDLVTFALGVVVLACAVLLITLAAIRLMPHHASEPVRRAKPAYSGAPSADQDANAPIPTPPTAATSENSASAASPVVPATAMPAQASAASATKPLSSAGSGQVLTLPEGLAEGNLLYRVEPDYPEEARRQGVQGSVVLDLHIGKDGLVQGVDPVSGQPLLAQAATAAVKQWRFRTRYVNGSEVEMQTRITLHFALPTP